MRTEHHPGSIKKFLRTPWRFQRTFHTPLSDLDSFSAAILRTLGAIDSAIVTIDAVVMDPIKLQALLASKQLAQDLRHETSLIAETTEEVQPLLAAALGDWVDFLFAPSPKPFVLYADHDEYTTFFANTKSNLGKVTSVLEEGGFRVVENYTRTH